MNCEPAMHEVFFKMFSDGPFQSQELQLQGMIVLLVAIKDPTGKGDGVVFAITLFLGQPCPKAFF